MALGVKEGMSGKRFALTVNGSEVRVCGGKGSVYLSGNNVALRCVGKTSIVVTKKMKQSVLRMSDVTLLELRDTFYANGTLTKYEVIDMDAATLSKSVMLAATAPPLVQSNGITYRTSTPPPSRVVPGASVPRAAPAAASQPTQHVVSSYFHRPSVATRAPLSAPPAPPTTTIAVAPAKTAVVSPKDVSAVNTTADGPVSATKKRMAAIVLLDDDDQSDDSDNDHATTLVQPGRAAKKARAIVESDGDDSNSEDDVAADAATNAKAIESDVSSPREDDVFAHELKQETLRTNATNWMAAYANGSHAKDAKRANDSSSGWHSVSDLKTKRNGSSSSSKLQSKAVAAARAHRRELLRDDTNDSGDDDDDTNSARTHDEVGQLLHECEQLAAKLRQSITSWSPASVSATDADAATASGGVNDEQTTIMAIDSTTADRRVVTQRDIPHICDTLELKPYQVVGVNWLLLLCEHNVSGVLADEMGLGKTVQTIAFLLLLDDLAKKPNARVQGGPHLVVVPASVLSNWEREFAWIAPTLRVVVYHGHKDARMELQDTLTPDDVDVLLTTYSYFERDSCQDDRTFLRSFAFGYMILDEGHSIKNAKTSRFKRISQMRARSRLVLSGTPIQNNLNELLALLSFLMPRMFDHGSDELLLFFDGSEQHKCAKVRQILAPFILRREKKYVLHQLVAKSVHVEMLTPGAAQRRAYADLIESVIAQKAARAASRADEKQRKLERRGNKRERQVHLLLGLDDPSPSSTKSTSKSGKDAAASDVAIFTQLRKAANHPVLLRNHYVDDNVLATMSRCLHRAEAFGTQCSIAMVRKELESYCDFELHDLCVQYSGNDELRQLQLPIETLLASAKFEYLRKLLPTLQTDGHRVLIFSQWTKLLDLLEVLMAHMKYRYLRLDGSTDVAARQDLIDTYNSDTEIFVFLLSTRAGGLGINLTAADTVILHDLDFNPTNDEQACDRCHRIGQTKPVGIYKLVTENTVDHDIYKLGESKTQLNNAVLGKLNAHSGSSSNNTSSSGGSNTGGRKASDSVTVEMMLASVISNYQADE